jgi:lipoprotein signal peptidase
MLVGSAAVVVALDLAQKGLAISEQGRAVFTHERSPLYVVGVVAAAVLWAGAVSLVGSSSIALAGGLVVGGAAGNVVSIALWPSLPGVPDPIVAGSYAFNVADVATALGLILLLPATLVFAGRNLGRLREQVSLRR